MKRDDTEDVLAQIAAWRQGTEPEPELPEAGYAAEPKVSGITPTTQRKETPMEPRGAGMKLALFCGEDADGQPSHSLWREDQREPAGYVSCSGFVCLVDPETELVTCHRCGATHRQDTEVISELRRQRVRLDMLYTCWCPNCSFERDAREAIIVQLAELLSLQANLGSLYPHPGPPSLPLQ